MYLRLILMRHATASQDITIKDLTRPLTKKGLIEAQMAAEFLSNFQIDKLLTSPAKRAMQTANILSDKITVRATEIIDELYEQSNPDLMLDFLHQQDNEQQHLLLVGHNPLISEIGLYLSSQESPYYQALVENSLPPGAIIMCDFAKIDKWSNIQARQAIISQYYLPSS